jgi:glycosyltransferase involved in cell wall biosynthesis
MDCYPDFSKKMSLHLQVAFRPRLPGKLHEWARKFVSPYGRAPDELRPWTKAAHKAISARFPDLRKEFSLIASFGEPMSGHLLALQLKRQSGLPWLAHFSDPWSDNPFRKPFVVANLINKRLEGAVIAKADKVVFTSEETRRLVMRKYPSAFGGKTAVLPHSFDPELYPIEAPNSGNIVVRYLGTFYARRSPMPVLRALQHILQETPAVLARVRFEFIGGVAPRFVRAARRTNLPDGLVNFLPSVGYAQSMRLMVDSDLLLVVDAPAKVSVFLPSKLVDYVGARVPILGTVPPGSSAKLIREMGGVVADPSCLDLIVKAISNALDECRARRIGQVKGWGDETVRSRYSIESVEKIFTVLLEETTAVGL